MRIQTCLSCSKEFEIYTACSNQKYCDECGRPGHPERVCSVCGKSFKPMKRADAKCCSKECRIASRVTTNKQKKQQVLRACNACGNLYEPRSKQSKFCSVPCARSKQGSVNYETWSCICCFKEFKRYTGISKFSRICSKECEDNYRFVVGNYEMRTCERCNNEFECRSNLTTRYCSSECAYDGMYDRPSGKIVVLTCEGCKNQFETQFVNRFRRFCSRSCATTGERNPMFGKSGPMTGKHAWNFGFTKETDERLAVTGQNVSMALKALFASGELSHVGSKNSNFGRTRDTRTPENLENYSRAASQRIIDGVSGYGSHGRYYHQSEKLDVATMVCKSRWEKCAAICLDFDDDCISWEYEPLRIPYIDENGDPRNYVPDFVTCRKDGVHIVEVKDVQNVDSVRNLRKFEAARAYTEECGWKFVVWTENELEQFIDVHVLEECRVK